MPLYRDVDLIAHEDQLRERWRRHRRVLVWRYGVDKALNIIAGFDDEANEDRAKWYALGTSKKSGAKLG